MSTSASQQILKPLVTLKASPLGPKCPFGNELIEFSLNPGGCVCLSGASGLGKSTLAMVLTGLSNPHTLEKLQIHVECDWDSSILQREKCGILFQTTTLMDELTVAGNLNLALKLHRDKFQTPQERDLKIKQLLDSVGLDYDRDAGKRPTELSGGMGRRASLALQLAQHKRVIVLDEPFTGLDYQAAVSVAKELVHLRNTQSTALVLISHEPHLTKIVMDPNDTKDNMTIELISPTSAQLNTTSHTKPTKPSLFGTSFYDRFLERHIDYTLYSLPLIVCAFVACGLAIGMLTADLLQRLDINTQVLDLVTKEVKPLIKMLTGDEANALQMMGIRFKVNDMLNRTVPPAKAELFAIGLTKLFVLEVGPLLTALLLCGRIGGAYAGKIGTLQATSQDKLLKTLGVNPQLWTFAPSMLAAIIAAPLLTMIGTTIALILSGWVGPVFYGIGSSDQFWSAVKECLFPTLRLRSFAPLWDSPTEGEVSALWRVFDAFVNLDYRVTFQQTSTWIDTFIEIVTYPPFYHLTKAVVFIILIMGVAEGVARWQPNLTPRGVPGVITASVVSSGLLVILADWGFSQLWLQRK